MEINYSDCDAIELEQLRITNLDWLSCTNNLLPNSVGAIRNTYLNANECGDGYETNENWIMNEHKGG